MSVVWTAPAGPVITGVSNSASGAAGIESGSWVSIYGTALSGTTRSWQASDFNGNNLPTTLDNVSVTINGKKAAIYYISSGMLDVLAPADTTIGPVSVQVTNAAGTATGTATLTAYSPGIFSVQAKYASALHNTDAMLVAPTGFFGTAATSLPAQSGETLQLYATGLGPTAPAVNPAQTVAAPAPIVDLTKLQVTIGGLPATVQYAGVTYPGVYQVNVIVPQLANGDQTVVATIGGVSSQKGVSVPIQNWVGSQVTVAITAASKTIRCGTTTTLSAKLANTTNQGVIWLVNGLVGGNAAVGTVSSTGVYTAPADLFPAGRPRPSPP